MKKGYIILIAFTLILVALYLYLRNEAQRKGWHKDKFWADFYGVNHYTQAEADLIAAEFADILENPFPEDDTGWSS